MQLIYFIFCVLVVWETTHRRIDFLSIAAASFILYTSNCLIGEVWVPQSGFNAYESAIHLETYVLICAQLFIIFAFFYLKKKNIKIVVCGHSGNKIQKRNDSFLYNAVVNKDNKFYWIVVLLISAGSIAYNLIFRIGLDTFFSYTAKGDILNETSFLFGIAIWGGLICFFHFFTVKKKIGSIVSAAVILTSVLLGSRAHIASALVGVLIIKSFGWHKKKREKIRTNKGFGKNNRKIIVLAFIMLMFLIMYKLVYKEIRAGDIEGVLEVLKNPKTWSDLFDIDELRIVCANYNYVIEKHIKLPIMDVIARLVSMVPFANDYIPIENPLRFSTILRQEINTTYGLASNFWGECYAMGGVVFLMLMTFVWMTFINKITDLTFAGRSPFLLTVASYLSFYIHRLDWTQVMGCIKIVILFYLIKMIFDLVFGKKSRKRYSEAMQ